MRARIIFVYVLLLVTQPVSAGSLAEQQALEIESSIQKLDRINYLPNLLPVILKMFRK